MVMKVLDYKGLQTFKTNVIGDKDISSIGDGTLKGAVKNISDNMPSVTDSYDATSSKAMSGKAVAAAIEGIHGVTGEVEGTVLSLDFT